MCMCEHTCRHVYTHSRTCVCGTSVSYAHINLSEFVGTYCPSPHNANHDARNFEIIYMMPLWLSSLSFCQPLPCKRLPVLEFFLQDQLQLHLRHLLLLLLNTLKCPVNHGKVHDRGGSGPTNRMEGQRWEQSGGTEMGTNK